LKRVLLVLLLVARSAVASVPTSTPLSDVPRADSTDSTVTQKPDPPLAFPAAETGPAQQATEVPPPSPAAASWPRQELPVSPLWDGIAAGALGAATLIVQFGVPNPSVPKWSSTTGFDDWVRGWLKISSESGRNTAAFTSDLFVYTLAAAPFINAFFVAGWEHERWDVAWKLAALDAETLLTVTFVSLSLQKLTARERPFVKDCQTNPNLSECSIGGKYASFPSAHTSVVFAAVALECFHHGFLDTSHTGWGAAVCPVTIVVATGTALLRVAADRHWATDVIAGALLGGGLGYAIPALHIAFAQNKDTTAVITPAVSTSYLGLSVAGRF
jgi:membrane-associated phospholipid phosphatase